MTNISGPARLGANPKLKKVGQGEDKQFVCEMRVKFLNAKESKDSGDWEDNGFWAQLNIWGKCAENASKLFEKGDRIEVINGNMVEQSWPDKEDPELMHSMMQVNTNSIAPYIPDLEVLKYKARKSDEESVDKNAEVDSPRTGTDG